jgi:hypothetical protein
VRKVEEEGSCVIPGEDHLSTMSAAVAQTTWVVEAAAVVEAEAVVAVEDIGDRETTWARLGPEKTPVENSLKSMKAVVVLEVAVSVPANISAEESAK